MAINFIDVEYVVDFTFLKRQTFLGRSLICVGLSCQSQLHLRSGKRSSRAGIVL